MEFRCGASVAAAASVANNASAEYYLYFPCQHGGPCLLDETKGEYCAICDDGWEHDFYGFGHFYNCGIPSWAPMTFCIVHAVILALGLIMSGVLIAKGYVKPGKTRTVTFINLGCAVFAWLSVLFAYIQGGLFELSLVSLLILGVLGYSISPFIIPVLLRPVATITNNLVTLRRISFGFRFISFLLICVHVSLVIVALVRCRDEDKRVFNMVTLAAVWNVNLAVLIQGVITIVVSKRLGRFFTDFGQRFTSSNNNPNSSLMANQATLESSGGSGGSGGGSPTDSSLRPTPYVLSMAEQRHKMIVGQLWVIHTFSIILLSGSIFIIVPLILFSMHHSLPFLWFFHIVVFPLLSLTFPLRIPFVRGASTKLTRVALSSSGHRHIISEGADILADDAPGPTLIGLGIRKKKRHPPWRVRIGNILSRISEEQSQGESRMKTFASRAIMSEAIESNDMTS